MVSSAELDKSLTTMQRHSSNFSSSKSGKSGWSGESSLGSSSISTGSMNNPKLFHLAQEQRWRKLRRVLRSRNRKKCIELCQEKDQSGLSALGVAIGYGAPLDIIRLIVSIDPCQLDSTDCFGATPLHLACLNGASIEVCKYLIQHNSGNVFKPDCDNRIPVHHAIECVCSSEIYFSEGMKVIVALCEIDPTLIQVPDKHGDTPVDLIQIAISRIKSNDSKYRQLRWLYGFARDLTIKMYMRKKLSWEEAGCSTLTSDTKKTGNGEAEKSCRTGATAGVSEDEDTTTVQTL